MFSLLSREDVGGKVITNFMTVNGSFSNITTCSHFSTSSYLLTEAQLGILQWMFHVHILVIVIMSMWPPCQLIRNISSTYQTLSPGVFATTCTFFSWQKSDVFSCREVDNIAIFHLWRKYLYSKAYHTIRFGRLAKLMSSSLLLSRCLKWESSAHISWVGNLSSMNVYDSRCLIDCWQSRLHQWNVLIWMTSRGVP